MTNKVTIISQLPVGHQFTPAQYHLRPDEVGRYLDAVEDSSTLFRRQDVVPPTALAAYALKGILREIDLPGGAVHAAQDLSFSQAVGMGETVVFRAKLSQNSIRSGWRYLTIDLSATVEDGSQVMEGRSTILIPEATEEK